MAWLIESFNEQENINESSYLLLEKAGIDKDAVKDKSKLEKLFKDRETPWGKIKFALFIIGLVVLALPIAVTAPIWITIFMIISKYKEKVSFDKLVKTKKSLEKSLKKLEAKKAKEPENSKEYDKVISELKKQIDDLEKEIHKAETEQRLYHELKAVANAYAARNKDQKKMYIFTVYESPEDDGFIIEYSGMSDSEVYKLAEDSCWGNNIIEEWGDLDNADNWDQSFVKLIKSSLGDPEYVYPLDAIDDTVVFYSTKTKKFLFGDWFDGRVYTLAQLRTMGKKLCKDEKYIEADAELGYYVLSKKDTAINESFLEDSESGWLIESFLNEEKLDTEDRNALRDSTFGLPKQRKYPLNDEQHVRSAIAYFNKCDPKDEEELARNIKKAMKKFNMEANVSPENRFSKYYKNKEAK